VKTNQYRPMLAVQLCSSLAYGQSPGGVTVTLAVSMPFENYGPGSLVIVTPHQLHVLRWQLHTRDLLVARLRHLKRDHKVKAGSRSGEGGGRAGRTCAQA
jgi:hypothetical protein